MPVGPVAVVQGGGRNQGTIAPRDRINISDFSGGLNYRDQPEQLDPTETHDSQNVTYNERGAVVKRLGYEANFSLPGTGPVIPIRYSGDGNVVYIQRGTKLFRRNSDGSHIEIKRAADLDAFTTNATCDVVDFVNITVVVHPVDGVLTWSGQGAIDDINGSPKGNSIDVWQNAVWIVGDPDNPVTLYRSANGDATDWNTVESDTLYNGSIANEIRDIDDAPLTVVKVATGNRLIVSKRKSVYAVQNDEGSYTTISVDLGFPNPRSLVSWEGNFYGITRDGIIATNGSEPPVIISERIEPLFHSFQLNEDLDSQYAAGVYEGRLLFSYTRTGKTENDRTLEFHPKLGWFALHTFGTPGFINTGDTSRVYMGSGSNGKFYECFVGGSDDGEDISSRFRTAWFAPSGASRCVFQSLRFVGRSKEQLSLGIALNYNPLITEEQSVDFVSSGALWGQPNWGEFDWSSDPHPDFADFPDISGEGTAISFLITETSKETISALIPGLEIGTKRGAWSLNELEIIFTPIEHKRG